MQLYEKYRPETARDLVGHARAKRALVTLIKRDDFDRGAFLLSGPSGIGKTSLALMIAKGLCGAVDMDITEIDGADCGFDRVKELENHIAYGAWGPSGWKAFIVNECHSMTPKAVQAWLTLLERLPARRLVFFTTTKPNSNLFGEFAGPFASRCYCLALETADCLEPMAERAREIATIEGLNGKAIEAYRGLVKDCQCNFREVLNRIEMGVMLL